MDSERFGSRLCYMYTISYKSSVADIRVATYTIRMMAFSFLFFSLFFLFLYYEKMSIQREKEISKFTQRKNYILSENNPSFSEILFDISPVLSAIKSNQCFPKMPRAICGCSYMRESATFY